MRYPDNDKKALSDPIYRQHNEQGNNNNNNNNQIENDDGIAAVSNLAKTIFTKKNVDSMKTAVGEKLGKVKRQAEDGDNSLRVLAILGGIMLIAVACLEFVGKVVSFHVVGAIVEVYSFVVGIMVLLIESRNFLWSQGFQEKIFKYALFLKFLWGRGCLYFIVGTMQLYHIVDIFNFIAGLYMCCLGALMIFIGQRTAYKLKNMRRSLFSEEELQQKFAQCDVDGDGGLDIIQFRMLTNNLCLDMTRRETEAAFLHMKKTVAEKLTYEEFHAWWNDTEMEENIDENGFTFV